MELSLGMLAESIASLAELADTKMGGVIGYKVSHFLDRVNSELKTFYVSRNKLIKDHWEEYKPASEDGSEVAMPNTIPELLGIIAKEGAEKLESEIDALCGIKIDFSDVDISKNELMSIETKPKCIMPLLKIAK